MKDKVQLLFKNEEISAEALQKNISLIAEPQIKMSNPALLIEKVLISKLQTGDTVSFCYIFSAYYKDLVMFANRFTYDLECSEDIVQEVFTRLWEERELVNPTVSLKSYLLKIVQNKCIDWYRHQKILHHHVKSVKENPIHFEYDTDSYVLYSELYEKMEAALALLPEGISDAFRINRFKGLKYHEIAVIQKVSVRTIEVRIGQALHLLRNHLKEYFILCIGLLNLIFRDIY